MNDNKITRERKDSAPGVVHPPSLYKRKTKIMPVQELSLLKEISNPSIRLRDRHFSAEETTILPKNRSLLAAP